MVRQGKIQSNKARYDQSRQDRVRQGKIRSDMAIYGQTRQDRVRQDKIRSDKVRYLLRKKQKKTNQLYTILCVLMFMYYTVLFYLYLLCSRKANFCVIHTQ